MENETNIQTDDTSSLDTLAQENNTSFENNLQEDNAKTGLDDKKEDKAVDTSNLNIPDEYINEDGTVNINLLVKKNNEYSAEKEELTAKANLAEQLQNEREELARNLGFKDHNALLQYQKSQSTTIEQAQFEANEYAKFLHKVSNPEDVRSLLIQYAQSPNPYLLKQIEAEFDTDVIKSVAQSNTQYKANLEYEKYQNEAREFITDAVNRHKDMFQDEAFKELFSESIKFAGNRFSSDELVRIAKAIGDNAVQRYIKEQNLKRENQDLTNNLIDNAPNSKKSDTQKTSNLLDLNDDELALFVEKNI